MRKVNLQFKEGVMDKERENELIMIAARWESICDLLEGKEVDEFMLSFPEVRQVADLVSTQQYYTITQKGERK